MKLFIAGPEVFLPNARDLVAQKCELVRAAGFAPVSPFDPGVPDGLSGLELALAISANDERLIRESDLMIANLTPFRGVSADAGTVFELGFMCALERPVHGYSNIGAGFGQRTVDLFKGQVVLKGEGMYDAPDGTLIEEFGMADNLMIDGGILRRNGIFICRDVAPGDVMTNLDVFKTCLDKVAALHLG